MKFTKPDLHFLVLCISALILFAVGGARVIHSSNDFVPVYTGARCLLHGCNPYDPSQLEQQFFQGGGHAEELPSWQIDVPVYPPSTFLALSPLALLRFPRGPLALVPFEWQPVGYLCRTYSIHLPTLVSVAGHNPGLVHRSYSRNSAGTGSTRGVRHSAANYRQLSLSARPQTPSCRFSVDA